MSNDDDNPNDRDALIRDAWRRLTRLEIEAHRIKAMLARMEAVDQDRAADALARLLAENSDDAAFASALTSYVDGPPPAPQPADRRVSPDDTHPAREAASPIPGTNGLAPNAKSPPEAPPIAKPLVRVDPPHGSRVLRPHIGAAESSDAGALDAIALPENGPSAAARHVKRRRARRSAPPWVTSVAAHVATLVVLGLVSIATFQEEEPWLAATVGEPDEAAVSELADVEIAPPDPVTDAAGAAPLEAALSEIVPLTPWEVVREPSTLPLDTTGEIAFAELPLGTAGLLEAGGADEGDGTDGGGDGNQAGPPPTNFFGAEARASRIVFVVDNSNSMDEGRFETALLELARSVDSLARQQSFYVIFYSDAAYGLFHPLSEESLVPATRENKLRLRAWLQTAEMCVGGRIIDAFKTAADLQPQVVYLLSDGVISEFPIAYLTEDREWSFTVHTIGMTVPDRRAAQNLMAIAAANGGAFRPVGVAPLAVEMARRRPIKKNRTRGRVWGVKLPENAPN